MSDLDVAAAVRVSARAEVIAGEADEAYAYADRVCQPSYAAAFAVVLRYLIETGNAEALQVAVSEFDFREAQDRRDEDDRRRHWDAEYAEKARRHELALQAACPVCGVAPGEVCRTTGSTGPKAKGLDDHKARYRAATSERPAGS